MKSEKTIRKKIKEIVSDERYHQPPALIQVNAPLALIQVSMKSKVDALKWVLENK